MATFGTFRLIRKAFLGLRYIVTMTIKKTIYLSNVFVDEERRKEGIGNSILNAADKIAKKMNADSICLKVKRESFVHEWYKRHGYSDLCTDEEDKEFTWMVKRFRGGSN